MGLPYRYDKNLPSDAQSNYDIDLILDKIPYFVKDCYSEIHCEKKSSIKNNYEKVIRTDSNYCPMEDVSNDDNKCPNYLKTDLKTDLNANMDTDINVLFNCIKYTERSQNKDVDIMIKKIIKIIKNVE